MYIYIYIYIYVLLYIGIPVGLGQELGLLHDELLVAVEEPKLRDPRLRCRDTVVQFSSGSLAPDGALACARMCW